MEIYKKQKDSEIEVNICHLVLMCLLGSTVVATGIILPKFIEPEFLAIAKESPGAVLAVWVLVVVFFTTIFSIIFIPMAERTATKVNFLRKIL
jgi:hypothetical protein